MKPYVPTPPAGAQPGPLWGTEDHVRALFGDRVTDFQAQPHLLTVEQFENAETFRDFFKKYYGPTIAAYRNIADDPERTEKLDQELADLARRNDADTGIMTWEYLVITATKRA